MSQELVNVGKIIHDYRMSRDISVPAFAASVGRTTNWVYNIERTGRGFERTWERLGSVYPDLKQTIIRVIGRYPPQEFAIINEKIQASRGSLEK